MKRFNFGEEETSAFDDLMKKFKAMGGQGVMPPVLQGIPGALFLTMVIPGPSGGRDDDELIPSLTKWLKGPLRMVFESVRSKGKEYDPVFFLAIKQCVIVSNFGNIDKSEWIECARKIVSYARGEHKVEIYWCVLATDTFFVRGVDAPGAERWLAENGTLEGHPNAENALMIHAERVRSSDIERTLVELVYELKDGAVVWSDSINAPLDEKMGRMAKPIL